jgi:hypothetical protein
MAHARGDVNTKRRSQNMAISWQSIGVLEFSQRAAAVPLEFEVRTPVVCWLDYLGCYY